MLDAFPRFAACVQDGSPEPKYLLELLNGNWIFFMGAPRYAIRDGGPAYVGELLECTQGDI